MSDLNARIESLKQQRAFQHLLPQGRRNIHQVIAMIEVFDSEPDEKDLDMKAGDRILLISAMEDIEGKKRDPRWSLLKYKRHPAKVTFKEKQHLKDLERIELKEARNCLLVNFSFQSGRTRTVYCDKSEKAKLNEVMWWAIQTCRYYFRQVPASNLVKREIDDLTMDYGVMVEEWDGSEGSIQELLSPTQNQILKMLKTDSKEEEKSEKKRKATSYQVEINITPEEAKTIEGLLDESGLGVEDINLLESHLRNELAEMENENIQALFSKKNRATTEVIIQHMGEIKTLVNEMASWMSEYEGSLDEMRKGVRKIEARNKKLKIQEQNHQRLQERLNGLLTTLRLDRKTQRNLRQPDFRTRLKEMLMAASALNKTMHVRLNPGMERTGIEKIKAVQQIRSDQKNLAKQFTDEAAKFLSEYFRQLSNMRISELKSQPDLVSVSALEKLPHSPARIMQVPRSLRAGTAASAGERKEKEREEKMGVNLSEGKTHETLRKYIDLVTLLAKMEPTHFESLLDTYTTEFRKVYEGGSHLRSRPPSSRRNHSNPNPKMKIKAYVSGIKRCSPAPMHKETRMCMLKDYSIDAEAANAHAAGKRDRKLFSGGNTHYSDAGSSPSRSRAESRVSSVMHSDNESEHTNRYSSAQSAPRTPVRRQAKGGGSAFVRALEDIAPMCRNEQSFLFEFFAADAEAPNAASTQTAIASSVDDASSEQNSLSQFVKVQSSRSLLSRDRKQSGGTTTEGKPEFTAANKAYDRIRGMMEEMFKSIVPQLENIAKNENRHDHFQTLRMLIESRRHKEANTDVNFLSRGFTSLQSTLQITFNNFINAEIRWIAAQKSTAKKNGILVPLLKFPSFINQMEDCIDDSGEDMQITATYTKMAKSLFKLIKDTADTNQKKGRKVLVLTENFHFFWKVFDTRIPRIKCLNPKVDEAHRMYLENLKEYVQWHIEYEMEKLSKFWDDMNDKLSNNQMEELQFLIPKQAVISMVKKTLPNLQKSVVNMYKRVEKHLPINKGLRDEVWRALTAYFLERFKRFEGQVQQCYSNVKELPKTSSDVKKIFALVSIEKKKH